jgi:hypothetical protein
LVVTGYLLLSGDGIHADLSACQTDGQCPLTLFDSLEGESAIISLDWVTDSRHFERVNFDALS